MTIYPHRIRLRGPWDCQPLTGAAGLTPGPAVLRMTMPCRWGEAGLEGFAGTVRFRRRFGYPGTIDSNERVWLTCAGLTGTAEVSLNGKALGQHGQADGAFEHEITQVLRPRNELIVEVAAPDDRGGLWGEWALEVRRTAFLRRLHARLEEKESCLCLHVAGEVVGSSDRPLELYALLAGHTVIYTQVEAAARGRRFEACGPLEKGQATCPMVRVDLVDGAVIWYVAEVPLG